MTNLGTSSVTVLDLASVNGQGDRRITTTFNAQLIVNAMIVVGLSSGGAVKCRLSFASAPLPGSDQVAEDAESFEILLGVPLGTDLQLIVTLPLTGARSVAAGLHNVGVQCERPTAGTSEAAFTRATLTVVAVAE